ncbi:MAG: efflux RND transporter periplasmic adaptor subunit [Rhodobacteraceae bacterium]|nr:efflux RND transporter periplasmic adaptor subunit [Paracoccaceae bacterium]
MTKNQRLAYTTGAIAAILLLAYAIFGGGEENLSETADKAQAASHPAISVAPVRLSILKDQVRASGLVGAVERVLVQPQIEGQPIDQVLAEVGDHVAAGAVLAQLSDTALKLQKSQLIASRASAAAQIAQAEAQRVEAQSAADEAIKAQDRAAQLHKQGNLSQAAFDQANSTAITANARVTVATQGALAAQAQMELVDAQLSNVDLQLNRTQVKAPFAGEIVEKNTVAGGIASATALPMFVLVRDGLLELNADVAEQDLPRLSAGQKVSLRAAGLAAELTGTVRLVEPAIDTQTRLGRARITIDQSDRIRSGMFLEAAIAISEREVLAVPVTAAATDEKGSFVMVVDAEGKVHRTGVGLGVRDGDLVEIIYGVTKDMTVVVKAASFVRDGDLVNPIAAASAEVTN